MEGASGTRGIPETFTVRLTQNGRNDLAMIADKLGISYDEALSRAVGTLAVLVEEQEAGTEIILKHKNGAKQTLPVQGLEGDGGHRHS